MVPSGWEETRLGKLAEKVTSGSRDWAKYYSDSGSKFIRMTNLARGGIYLNLDDLRFVDVQSDSSDGKRTSLQYGDILISITAELGKIGWVDASLGEAFINQHTALVRIHPNKAFSKYLAYLLASHSMNHKINRLNDAGAKAGLNLSTIRSIPVLLPSLFEQKKIAQILSTWDQAITTSEQLLANSQQQKKALMQQLLTGKKRLLDNNGVRFSGEWKHGHLSDLGKIAKGKALSSKNIIDGDYPVIAGGKTSPYNHQDFTHENVITVSASGAYAGYVAYHRYKFWASDCSVVSNNSGSDIGFIYQVMTYLQTKIYSLQSGGAQPHVYPKDLDVLRVQIPAIEEQQKIATVLTAADQEIDTLKQKLTHLKQEKKALMQKLLTGKRRVKFD